MRVKICGLRRIADVEAAVEAGADAVGFVFAESVRRLTPEEAAPLIARVPANVLKVGVLRGPDSGPLERLGQLGLDAVQIERASEDAVQVPRGVTLWSVLRDGEDLLARARAFEDSATLLIDSETGGGSGRRADLDRVAGLAALRPVILAGGLDPGTVADAIRRVRPCGVDVSSGVESAPGIKDPVRIRAFVRAAREAASGLPEGAITPCP